MIAADFCPLPLKNTPLSILLAVALSGLPAAWPTAQAQVRLPSLGDGVSEDFGIGAEKKLGEQIMRQIRPDPDYLDDPLLLEYVQSLWKPLVAAARQRGEITSDTDGVFAWEAFLVRDRSVNAFALPGGYIGIHLGLIAATFSRDELASVMAHELSHVTQRHIARSMASASRQSLYGLAAMVLGMVAAGRAGNADMANAAIVGSQAAMVQGQLNFSRDVEREADRIGFGVLTTAGFSPAGMAAMFERLENASRLNDNGAYPYLRSHPLTSERIGEARQRAQNSGNAAPPVPTLEHTLMQARSRVLADSSVQALRRVQSQDAGPGGGVPATAGERLGALYGSTLASIALREPTRAQTTLTAALSMLRSDPALGATRDDRHAERLLTLAQAQTYLAAGTPQRAFALLDEHDDGSRAWMLMRAQATLDAKRGGAAGSAELKRSTEALQTWVTDHTQDALAWGLLAQCAEQLGLRLRAVRAEAESRAAVGDLSGAIDRLRAGQRLARSAGTAAPDFIDASVIDARLRQINTERRQIYADLNNGRMPPE